MKNNAANLITLPNFSPVNSTTNYGKFLGSQGTVLEHFVRNEAGKGGVAANQIDLVELKSVISSIQYSAEKIKELQRNCSGTGSLAPTNGRSETCDPKIPEQIRGHENTIYQQIGNYLKFGGGLSVGAGAAIYDEIMGIGSDVVELADGTTLVAFEKNLGALKAKISEYIVNGQIDYNKIKNSLVTGTSAIELEIGAIITALPSAIAALDAYLAGYYTGKIGGGIVLEFVNPVKKAKLITKGFSTGRWMDEARVIILANKYGKGVIGKFDTIHDIASSKLGKYAEEFRGRMARMDDYMLSEYLNNPDKYIDTYRKGGKYNLLKQPEFDGNKYAIIFENGKFKNFNGNKLPTTKMDFVVIDGNIKYGFKHSYISDGKNVEYAGQIDFDGNGNVISWSNQSGHYQPSVDSKNSMSDLFQIKYGVNLNNINFINITN